MALVAVHQAALNRLRATAGAGVERSWLTLGSYDERDVDRFLARVIPVVAAAQQQAAVLTIAYLARLTGSIPPPLDLAAVTGAAVRNGTAPAEVYRRPFVTTWTALKAGALWEVAVASGGARARMAAQTDVQLSMRATMQGVQSSEPRIRGYTRVTSSPCPYCEAVEGAFVKSADAMPLHPGCVTGDSLVWAPPGCRTQAPDLGGAQAATRRRYRGEVVVLVTAAGHELTVTPNHPVLTERGWVAAGFLSEGDGVISSRRADGVCGRVPNEEDMPSRIEDRFRAGLVDALVSVPFTSEQFHGDRGDGKVDAVALNGRLDTRRLASLLQPAQHPFFPRRSRFAAGFACRCGRRQGLGRVGAPALGVMSGGGLGFPFSGSHVPRDDLALFARGALRDSLFSQQAVNYATADAVPRGDSQDRIAAAVALRDIEVDASAARHATTSQLASDHRLADANNGRHLLRRIASQVHLDCIVKLRRISGSHDVYNLVTVDGWYTANAIVVHNCGCDLEPVFSDERTTPLPETVAVHEHGELGPVLGDAEDRFTTETALD